MPPDLVAAIDRMYDAARDPTTHLSVPKADNNPVVFATLTRGIGRSGALIIPKPDAFNRSNSRKSPCPVGSPFTLARSSSAGKTDSQGHAPVDIGYPFLDVHRMKAVKAPDKKWREWDP